MTVWLVKFIHGWDGLESVDGVFSSEEIAEKWVSKQSSPDSRYSIDSLEVDGKCVE